MPTYTFSCLNKKCRRKDFEISCSMKDYSGQAACPKCGEISTTRNLLIDNPVTAVVRGDDQISLGELAERNNRRFSEDKKEHLFYKHNEYKNQDEDGTPLPEGMSKIKRPKNKRPFGSGRKRREITKRAK